MQMCWHSLMKDGISIWRLAWKLLEFKQQEKAEEVLCFEILHWTPAQCQRAPTTLDSFCSLFCLNCPTDACSKPRLPDLCHCCVPIVMLHSPGSSQHLILKAGSCRHLEEIIPRCEQLPSWTVSSNFLGPLPISHVSWDQRELCFYGCYLAALILFKMKT